MKTHINLMLENTMILLAITLAYLYLSTIAAVEVVAVKVIRGIKW